MFWAPFSSTHARLSEGGAVSRIHNPNTKAALRRLFGRVQTYVLRLDIWGPNLGPFSWLGLGLGLDLG